MKLKTKITTFYLIILFLFGFISLVNVSAQQIDIEQTQSKNYNNYNGDQVQLRATTQNMNELRVNGVEAKTNLNISVETNSQEKTKFMVKMNNGQEREIKVMPNVASEKALVALKIRSCTTENNCTIELKSVGRNNKEELKYEMSLEKNSRIFGFIPTKMNVKAEVNASSGETEVKRPWWSFMAVEI